MASQRSPLRSQATKICRIVVVIAFALVCTGNAAAQKIGELVHATVLNLQIRQLYGQGRYAEAIPLAREVLAIYEKALGPDHSLVATSLNNLAELYHDQGRYAEA